MPTTLTLMMASRRAEKLSGLFFAEESSFVLLSWSAPGN